MRLLLGFFVASLLMRGEMVDRLAITVGSTVITELQIDEDLRVASLLNGQPINRNIEARRAAADRLVEQLLIQHEIVISHYPPPSDEEIATFYTQIQTTLGGPEILRRDLLVYAVSEQTLRSHLKAQLATLRFIEARFTPDITISDTEIETAYRRNVSASQAAAPTDPVPPLDLAQGAKLSQELLAQRTDAALTSWLAESRKQIDILYIDAALQ